MDAETLRHYLAAASFLYALCCASAYACSPGRAHLLRLVAFTFLLALALFAHNWAVYVVVVVILGTSVTKTRFLETILALLMRMSVYFQVKSESEDEQLEKAEGELCETLEPTDVLVDRHLPAPAERPAALRSGSAGVTPAPMEKPTPRKYLQTEERALEYLRRRYGYAVRPHVRIERGGAVEGRFDGIAHLPDRDVLIEVKAFLVVRDPARLPVRAITVLRRTFGNLLGWAARYQKGAGRPTEVLFAFVGDFSSETRDKIEGEAKTLADDAEVGWKVEFIPLTDLHPED